MRTTHISPEFIYQEANGTLSMLEKKSFLGSKLIKFADSISILNQNIIYYENTDNEQLNINSEILLPPIIYNTINDKGNYTPTLNNTQPTSQLNNNTSWILFIDLKSLVINYLFATLKSYRTFEGIQNNMTKSNSINSAIDDYIIQNLLSRYQFDHIDLFINYNNLNNNGLRFQNNFDSTIENNINLTKAYTSKTDLVNLNITLTFNQTQPSTLYSFNYYYNVYFIKI